jgi:hypothetical protein
MLIVVQLLKYPVVYEAEHYRVHKIPLLDPTLSHTYTALF